MPCPRRSNRSRRAEYSPSSLPGLTPQVGFIRLAALVGADLGQARGPVQSIPLTNKRLFSMDARVKPAHDGPPPIFRLVMVANDANCKRTPHGARHCDRFSLPR